MPTFHKSIFDTPDVIDSKKPSTPDMVNTALKDLHNLKGSSLAAVKKFIANRFHIDTEDSSNRIKKYVKDSLASGRLTQTTGKGVAGSFKLSSPFTQGVSRANVQVHKKTSGMLLAQGKETPDQLNPKEAKTALSELGSSTPKSANKRNPKYLAKSCTPPVNSAGSDSEEATNSKKPIDRLKRMSTGKLVLSPKPANRLRRYDLRSKAKVNRDFL